MESKKMKQISAFVWWGIAVVPLLLALIYFCGYHLAFNNGITSASDLTSYHSNGINAFNDFLSGTSDTLAKFTPPMIKTPLNNVFTTLFGSSSTAVTISSNLFAWAVWVQLVHILFDFVCFIPKWIHCIMEKVGKH